MQAAGALKTRVAFGTQVLDGSQGFQDLHSLENPHKKPVVQHRVKHVVEAGDEPVATSSEKREDMHPSPCGDEHATSGSRCGALVRNDTEGGKLVPAAARHGRARRRWPPPSRARVLHQPRHPRHPRCHCRRARHGPQEYSCYHRARATLEDLDSLQCAAQLVAEDIPSLTIIMYDKRGRPLVTDVFNQPKDDKQYPRRERLGHVRHAPGLCNPSSRTRATRAVPCGGCCAKGARRSGWIASEKGLVPQDAAFRV